MGGIPETADVELAATRQPRRAQRALVALTTGLFAAGLIGLVVVHSDGDRPPTPSEELARAQQFIQRARTAHFSGTAEMVTNDGKDGLGSTYTHRSRISGELEIPFKSRWVDESGEYVVEGLVVENGTYFREADDRGALEAERWVFTPRAMTDEEPPVEGSDFAGAELLAMPFDAPDLSALLRAADVPVRVLPGVVKASIDVKKLDWIQEMYETADVPLPTIHIEVHSDQDGRLTRLLLDEKAKYPVFEEDDDEPTGESESVTKVDLQFSRWGEPVEIAAPSRAQVDPTPDIAEEDIAAFDAMPLLGLETLPSGFELVTAEVYAESDDEEFGECAEVDLEYGNGAELEAFYADPDEDADYPVTIDVTLTPAACDFYGSLEDEGDPIRLGRRSGTIVRSDPDDYEEYATAIEVIVGATRVTIESDLPERAVIAAASDLVPLDLATQPVHRVEPPQ